MQSSDNFSVQRSPRTVLFGPGQRAALPKIARSLGSRALIVTDERLRTSAELAELLAGLDQNSVAAVVFSAVEPELPVHCIHNASAAGSSFQADLVIAIGGGSCLDAAKLAALLMTHGGSLSDYYGEFKVPGPTLPVIAVPTTAGTGSEVTPVAVVADSERVLKVGISSPYLIPEVALCDPDLTMTCPPGLTAISGADALAHAIEAFTAAPRDWTSDTSLQHVFVGKNFLSDRHALAAIELICRNLARAYHSGDDVEARSAIMQGSLCSHGFRHCRDIACSRRPVPDRGADAHRPWIGNCDPSSVCDGVQSRPYPAAVIRHGGRACPAIARPTGDRQGRCHDRSGGRHVHRDRHPSLACRYWRQGSRSTADRGIRARHDPAHQEQPA